MTKFKWEAARKRDLLRRSNEDRLSRQELLRQQRAARKKKSTGGAVGVSKADRLASKKKTIAKVESYSVPKICSERVSAYQSDGLILNAAARRKITRFHERTGHIYEGYPVKLLLELAGVGAATLKHT
jgi:hypothetical protein